jgi:penicillin-binding protein 1A
VIVAIGPSSSPGQQHVPRHAAPKGSKPKKGFFRRFWWVFVATPLLMLAVVFGALVIAYERIQLPKALPPIQTSYLYDSAGHQLAALHGSVDRKIVPLGKISINLQNAVIATEDAGFYSNNGIDVRGIVRAAFTDLLHGSSVQGASTITEQLVKNVYAGTYVRNANGITTYVDPPRTVREKIREALLAIKLEHRFTKKEILARYLNTVYFGHGAYGAEAAAETYFGKHAGQLTPLESATLAGVLHAPTLYDPITSPYDNKFRRDYALDQMVHFGYLKAWKEAALKAQPCCGTVKDTSDQLNTPYGSAYFVDYTRQYLFNKYGSAKVYGGGLQVKTSLNMTMQKAAWDAVHKDLPFTTSTGRNNPSAAVVSIDPQTGQILAMVGGRDFNKSQLNLATFQGGTGRESGSAFKAFTLASALENGYALDKYWTGPTEITIDNPICDGPDGPWEVINAGDEEAGTFTLLQATEHSVNTVFAQVISQLGPEKAVDMAHRLGIKSSLPDVCAVTLGSVAVNPLEMTNAYATLDAQGKYHAATPLVSISNSQGTSLGSVASKGKQVVDPDIANQVTYALRYVVLGGTGYVANLGARPVAGKTGTANLNVDAWFCGYTVQLATCVWVGWPQGEIPLVDIEGVPSVYGGTIPALIWHDYMQVAAAQYPIESFPYPTFTGTLGPETPVSLPTVTPSTTPTTTPTTTPSGSTSPTGSPPPTGSPSPSPSKAHRTRGRAALRPADVPQQPRAGPRRR